MIPEWLLSLLAEIGIGLLILVVGLLAIVGGGVLSVFAFQAWQERDSEKRRYAIMSCPACRAVFPATMGLHNAKDVPDVLKEAARWGVGNAEFTQGEYLREEADSNGVQRAYAVRIFDPKDAAERLIEKRQREERARLLNEKGWSRHG